MCVLILYNEFKKAGAANRVPFLNTETTEEEETAFSQRTISAPEPGHCILHKWCTASLQLPSQPSLGWWLANFLPPAKSIFHQHVGRTDRMGLGCGEEWHGFLFFFFFLVWGNAEKEVARSQWWRLSGMKQTGMLLWWGYWGSSGAQVFRVCAEGGNSVLRSSLVLKSLFNFSQVMNFFWALDTS